MRKAWHSEIPMYIVFLAVPGKRHVGELAAAAVQRERVQNPPVWIRLRSPWQRVASAANWSGQARLQSLPDLAVPSDCVAWTGVAPPIVTQAGEYIQAAEF